MKQIKLTQLVTLLSSSVFMQLVLFTLPTLAKQQQPQSTSNKKANFKCDHKKFEAAIDRFFYTGDSDFIWPTTLAEQNTNCKKIKEVERYCKDYVENCLKRETRNIFKVLLYANSRFQRSYCLNDGRKRLFTTMGACMNRHRAQASALDDALNRDLHAVAAMPEKKLKIPILCCDYFAFKNRIMAVLNDCTKEELDVFEAFIDASTTDGFSLMCNVQENSDECKRLMKRLPKWTKPLKRKVSMIAGIDVIDSL